MGGYNGRVKKLESQEAAGDDVFLKIIELRAIDQLAWQHTSFGSSPPQQSWTAQSALLSHQESEAVDLIVGKPSDTFMATLHNKHVEFMTCYRSLPIKRIGMSSLFSPCHSLPRPLSR